MATMVDGLGGEELGPSGLGTTLISPYFIGSVTSESDISGANVYSTTNVKTVTFSGTNFVNSEGKLRSAKATATFGALVQAGSGTLSSNELWKVFGTAYTGKPAIAISNMGGAGSLHVVAGSLNAGSFFVLGEAATDEFGWVAVGI